MSDPCASEYRPSMYRWQVIDAYDKSTSNLARCIESAASLARAWNLGAMNGAAWAMGNAVLLRFGPGVAP